MPITADGAAEGPESFAVVFEDLQGGAGLGTDAAIVHIAADPEFLGTVSIYDGEIIYANEGIGYVAFRLNLASYKPGAVWVTLAMTPGTATPGADYVADPITVSLVNPSQGVTFGAQKSAAITIQDNDRKRSSGGGAFGFASWLLFAALGMLRLRAEDRVQRRTAT